MVQSTWIKISNYCIKSGDWTIAKYNVAGGVKYGLWFMNESKGFYPTADDAKAQAND